MTTSQLAPEIQAAINFAFSREDQDASNAYRINLICEQLRATGHAPTPELEIGTWVYLRTTDGKLDPQGEGRYVCQLAELCSTNGDRRYNLHRWEERGGHSVCQIRENLHLDVTDEEIAEQVRLREEYAAGAHHVSQGLISA